MPLPPRKRSQTGKLWPKMQATPATMATSVVVCTNAACGSGYGGKSPRENPKALDRNAVSRPSEAPARAASHPFSVSHPKTKDPGPLPNTRTTFVAPMFPLPCWRMSTPFHRPTR